jgi:hypothetical protein
MMGRERAIIRWDVHRQMLLDELRRLEQAQVSAPPEDAGEAPPLKARITELRAALRQMGPSPQAKMG